MQNCKASYSLSTKIQTFCFSLYKYCVRPLSLCACMSICTLSIPSHYNLIISSPKSAPRFVPLSLERVFQQKARGFIEISVMVMEDDWDLNAVVRGCSSSLASTSSSAFVVDNTAAYSSSATSEFPTAFDGGEDGQKFSLSDPFQSRNSAEELHEVYKPFFRPKSQALADKASVSSVSSLSCATAPTVAQVQQKQKLQFPKTQSCTTPRSKRRKSQRKKVCHVPAEALSADIWSWRKYGQKPIKGSPYPRGYYRCSSSKGCVARKQVERNRSDPRMFIVTYTAEHNHPAPTHKNSLAGSTRQKPVSPKATGDGDSNRELPTKPASPATPKLDEEEGLRESTNSESKDDKEEFVGDEEDDGLGLRDMELTDDFFTGFDEFTSPASFPDHFPATMAISSWMTNGTAAAAGTS